jgi:hypothetical protein
MDGDELRRLPLSMRKAKLAQLLARRPEGIFLNPFEQARSGLICFARRVSSGLRAWSRNIAGFRRLGSEERRVGRYCRLARLTAPARSREVKRDQALPRDHHWAAQRVRCAFSRRVRNIPHRTAANLSARAARFFARFNAHEIGVVVYCAACIEVPFCTFSPTSSSA